MGQYTKVSGVRVWGEKLRLGSSCFGFRACGLRLRTWGVLQTSCPAAGGPLQGVMNIGGSLNLGIIGGLHNKEYRI